MVKFKIGFREFAIIEQIGDKTYKVERKKKLYFAKFFNGDKEGFEDFIYAKKHIYLSGVTTPKLLYVDKKNLIVITEYIDGTRVVDLLLKSPLEDKIYDLIFSNSFFAKMEKINIDFSPEYWIYSNGKLYYFETILMPFNKEHTFTEKYIRLWFYTKEFYDHIISLGLQFDKSKIKQEYEINKQIVLTTCKFYK